MSIILFVSISPRCFAETRAESDVHLMEKLIKLGFSEDKACKAIGTTKCPTCGWHLNANDCVIQETQALNNLMSFFMSVLKSDGTRSANGFDSPH